MSHDPQPAAVPPPVAAPAAATPSVLRIHGAAGLVAGARAV